MPVDDFQTTRKGFREHRIDRSAHNPNWDAVKQINWPLVWARLKYYGWRIGTKSIVLIVYVTLIRDGLTSLFDPFATRLAKLPLLGFLDSYEITYKIDLALVTAIGIFAGVSYSWDQAIRLWALGDDSKLKAGKLTHYDRRSFVVYALAIAMLLTDLCLMYMAVTEAGWGSRGGFSFSALIVSILYAGVLVFVTFMSLQLEADVDALKEGV